MFRESAVGKQGFLLHQGTECIERSNGFIYTIFSPVYPIYIETSFAEIKPLKGPMEKTELSMLLSVQFDIKNKQNLVHKYSTMHTNGHLIAFNR